MVCGDGDDMMPRVLSPAFGLLMVAAAGIGVRAGLGFVAVALAALAVLAGIVWRPIATLAVLLTVAVLVLTEPPPMLSAVSGLAATAYLVFRYASAGVVTVSPTTMVAAVSFTLVGLATTVFPLRLPWLPLLAPLGVLGIFVLATRPFVGNRG